MGSQEKKMLLPTVASSSRQDILQPWSDDYEDGSSFESESYSTDR